MLDGDEFRTHLSAGLGFSKDDRHTQGTRIAFVAELLARNGVLALVPVIAPYADTRDAARQLHESTAPPTWRSTCPPRWTSAPTGTSRASTARRPAARSSHMTGVDDPYEVPESPDLRLDTSATDLAGGVRPCSRC